MTLYEELNQKLKIEKLVVLNKAKHILDRKKVTYKMSNYTNYNRHLFIANISTEPIDVGRDKTDQEL